jgi:glycosyltransferase involved in cell wall biosynthesis
MALARVRDFARQDYEPRDLVIVVDGGVEDRSLRESLERTTFGDITLLEVPLGALTLGALRNLSVRESLGDFLCQWDDDDMYHPRRLSRQMDFVLSEEADACVLGDQLQLMRSSRSLYWCDWTHPRGMPTWAPGIPNTLLCKHSSYPRYDDFGRNAFRSEDMKVMMRLHDDHRLSVLRDFGTSYVYVGHGSNTWDEGHLQRIVAVTGLTAPELSNRFDILCRDLAAFKLGGRLTVRAYDEEPVIEIDDNGIMTNVYEMPS